ncbi:MAG: archaetidylserine decarboxylase [Gemmatimonadota bacterium]|jgi:phosphatidylserine decarboxylase
MPGWRLALRILARLPQPALSRVTGRLADVRIPRPLRRAVLGAFAHTLHIDVTEAEKPLVDYPTFDAFFVRRLRAGSRSWPADAHAVAAPVDGIFGEAGAIEDGRLLQAKGREYTVDELLADDGDARRFDRGTFVTLYLSPRHYHRIHAPVAGQVTSLRRVPGALLPVNAAAVAHVDRLFPRNERAICTIDGPAGRVAVVAIGAFNVGRITASFLPAGDEDGTQITNLRAPGSRSERIEVPIAVERGAEIMAFHLGSTVVLLFEPGRVQTDASVERETEVRLGASIGSIRAPAASEKNTP